MKKVLLIALTVLLAVGSAYAVPAKRGIWRTLTLKDGTRVAATLKGDEFVSYYQANDGRAFQEIDGEVQAVDLQTLSVEHQKRAKARNQERVRRRVGTAPEGGYHGQKKGLVILVEFTDVKFTYDKTTFEDYFNKVGYNDYGMHGSVHDYFYEQSYGEFDLEFDVVGPITASHNAYYYSKAINPSCSRVATLVNQLCKEVDNEVDFSKYDWNKDGTVDQVYVIYAGWGAAQGADGTIWPHEYSVSAGDEIPYLTGENVTIDTYGISCELMGSSGSQIDGIGTSCHEFSHCLGLPDFYDTRKDGDNFGMHTWSLMDYGSYNGDGNGQCPSGYTAYERWVSGWLTPVELSGSCQIGDMPAIEDSPVAYVVYNDKNPDEYYLLANHQMTGFDECAYGHGLLVLHVDYNSNAWGNNAVNNEPEHQRMTIVPADNVQSIYSLSGDPFPGTSGNRELTDESTPAATLYNVNLDGSKFMGKPITDIVEANGLITFNFMGGVEVDAPVAKAAANITETGFTANWEAVSGAQEYTVLLTRLLPEPTPWDYLVFYENFEGFYNKISSTKTDVSDKLDDYTTLPGWTGSKLYRSPKNLRIGNTTEDGYIMSPVFDQPSQNAITIAISPLSTSASNTGELELEIYAVDYDQSVTTTISNIPVSSDTSGSTWLMSLPGWTYGSFKIGVKAPAPGIYLSLLIAFDGSYSWDDFPDDEEDEESAPASVKSTFQSRVNLSANEIQWSAAPSLAAQKASAPRKERAEDNSFYTTTGTSYNFENLEPGDYRYKVRVRTAEGYSPWSEEISVELVDGIQTLKSDSSTQGRTYYIDGRVATSSLRPGLYIRDGKKFIVK
ncbi:MAG: M6 family metalloprotease domain-containing protein [Bacteroidaceae bacterium]|nr:M6 family metalloprotease domain-containing protein [Bacteroidaceae bacterium]